MPRLFRVIVPVPDMEAAARLLRPWTTTLLDMEPDKVTPTRHYFDCDGVILALVDPSAHGRAFRANPDLVYLAVAPPRPGGRARPGGRGGRAVPR